MFQLRETHFVDILAFILLAFVYFSLFSCPDGFERFGASRCVRVASVACLDGAEDCAVCTDNCTCTEGQDCPDTVLVRGHNVIVILLPFFALFLSEFWFCQPNL
jgi:hypothetical protein